MFGAVALKINTTIYCANFKFAQQYTVCKFLSVTALILNITDHYHIYCII